MGERHDTWKGSVFARGRKLWLKVKGPGGWKQVRTSFRLGEERPRHVAALVRGWIAEKYAPRTVRNVYYTMKSMFRDAAVEGLLDSNPCILGRAQLPQIVDADPEWRAKAQYTRGELVALISDQRLPS